MIATRPILRFDSFGPVERVLHDIEVTIPRIFPEHAAGFVVSLKKMVRQYSNQYGWNTVVLAVSQGMPAEEVDNFLQFSPQHRGPLVVDPTLQNPQNSFYKDAEELKADRSRLTDLCDGGSDTLVILYGVDGISHVQMVKLLQARLCMLGMTFEMVKVDLVPDPHGKVPVAELDADLKRMTLAQNMLGELNEVLDKNISLNLDPDGNAVSGAIFGARNEIQLALSHGYDPLMRHNLLALDAELAIMPFHFSMYFPEPQVLPPHARPAPHAPDLRHNPIYADEMNPKPKY